MTDHRSSSSLWWLLLFSMFFQIFHYKQETGPLYYLAKIWPLLIFPLIVYGVLLQKLVDRVLYIVLGLYTMVLTPFLSMIHLSNGLLDAIFSTVKAWPLTFYFSVAGLLVLLRPSESGVARGALGAGFMTFGVLGILWVVVPEEWYQPTVFGANMFSWDEGRGNYIRMPMMLAMVALFYVGHCFSRQWRPWQFLLLAAGLAMMVVMYKARLPTGVACLILLMIIAIRLPKIWLWGLGAVSTLPAIALIIIFGPLVPDLIATTFDESLFIRLRSSRIALDWILQDPMRLILGSGSVSSFSDLTMGDYLGYADFFLADIGWLGVLMEYGVIGTGLIVAIHLRALMVTRAVRRGDPFREALASYVLFEILCSAVYSVMYAPGPVVTAAALAWWFSLRDDAGLARGEASRNPLPGMGGEGPEPEALGLRGRTI
ncbi:hypothetical protein [Falsiroseomonas tokyonensis]|uniref:O-antigen ligase domain-containing protein n=1 Tax=Falsiroseomonas tokyonensis TaxID=430521 RepID=A0ABV7C364_9PROT|nr:hypothetical protein [Falsiroseomonas tokyonensis]MBU8540744.1 hypothetical protein [Falsiroseomonas tokyonensis]